jgi:hypothetical protein
MGNRQWHRWTSQVCKLVVHLNSHQHGSRHTVPGRYACSHTLHKAAAALHHVHDHMLQGWYPASPQSPPKG